MRIGILGGMGAAASAHLLNTLVRKCQDAGAKTDSDFPEVVLFSMSSKGLDEKGIADEELILDELKFGIDLLNRCKVDRIIIGCNSVHRYLSLLRKRSKAEIIDMPKAAMDECGDARFGVISSRSCWKDGVYCEADFHCTDDEQDQIDAIVEKAIAGEISLADRVAVQMIIAEMRRRGAEKVILGCTELPLVYPAIGNVLDAGECAIAEALQ